MKIGTCDVMNLFKIVEKINDEIVELQMEEGRAICLIIKANGDFLEASFGGVTVWNSEETDSFGPAVMEEDLREEMDQLMKSFAKIPKLKTFPEIVCEECGKKEKSPFEKLCIPCCERLAVKKPQEEATSTAATD